MASMVMPQERRAWLGALAGAVLLTAAPVAAAEAALKVVASFSILADMTRNVAGDAVEVISLVGPDSDAHVFEPSPDTARRLAHARLVLVNGLGFEGWIDRLVTASGYQGPVVVASRDIAPLPRDQAFAAGSGQGPARGGRDPHAWQDLRNGATYVRTIAAALGAVDPTGATGYQRRAQAYIEQLDALDREIRAALDAVPSAKRRVITNHDAFQYFGRAYGVGVAAPLGLSTESQSSAGDLGQLVRQIRQAGVRALFIENLSDQRTLQQVARETGSVIGGKLYTDALSGPDGPAPSYLAMFRHNAAQLKTGMLRN